MVEWILSTLKDNPELAVILVLGLAMIMPGTVSRVIMRFADKALGRAPSPVARRETAQHEPQQAESAYVEVIVDSIKVVYVFHEELYVPISHEDEFDGVLRKLVVEKSDNLVVFDMTKTKSMNDVVSKGIKRLVEDISRGGKTKLTIVLPNVDHSDESLETACNDLYSYVAEVVDRTQNFHIKIKYDMYGNSFDGFDKLMMHNFFDSVDDMLLSRVQRVEIDDHRVRTTIAVMLGAFFIAYKNAYIRYTSLCQDGKACFGYETAIAMIQAIEELGRKYAVKYGAPESTVAAYVAAMKPAFDEYATTIRRTFNNKWRRGPNERMTILLDGAWKYMSAAYDCVYEMNLAGAIEPTAVDDVDMRGMRMEISTEVLNYEF